MIRTNKKLFEMVAMLSVILFLMTCCGVSAADRNSVKQSGEYYTGSVYGPRLSAEELNDVADAVADFLNEYIVEGMTDIQKVRMACGYLVTSCRYAESWAENRANTAWGSLVYHEAQCSGYARGFKALCDGMGIGCYYVHADENSFNPDHQWNEVCVDGKWYIVDTQLISTSHPIMGSMFYLISSEAYASMTGMSWDRFSVPECPESYYDDSGLGFFNDTVHYVFSDVQGVYVNGEYKTIQTYNLNDYNYVKLRDIAALVNGTSNQFDVVWDGNTNILWIDKNTPYTYVGGELETEVGRKGVVNPVSVSSFRVNGTEVYPDGYGILNNNYYRLRDIGELIGFDVDWDGTNAVINTK